MKLNEADIIRKIKERAWCKWVSCDVTYSKKFIYPSQSMQSYFGAGISIGNFSKGEFNFCWEIQFSTAVMKRSQEAVNGVRVHSTGRTFDFMYFLISVQE